MSHFQQIHEINGICLSDVLQKIKDDLCNFRFFVEPLMHTISGTFCHTLIRIKFNDCCQLNFWNNCLYLFIPLQSQSARQSSKDLLGKKEFDKFQPLRNAGSVLTSAMLVNGFPANSANTCFGTLRKLPTPNVLPLTWSITPFRMLPFSQLRRRSNAGSGGICCVIC